MIECTSELQTTSARFPRTKTRIHVWSKIRWKRYFSAFIQSHKNWTIRCQPSTAKLKWGASFRWWCSPNSVWGIIETTNIRKTHGPFSALYTFFYLKVTHPTLYLFYLMRMRILWLLIVLLLPAGTLIFSLLYLMIDWIGLLEHIFIEPLIRAMKKMNQRPKSI